eukprot:gene2635-3324_t
MHPPGLSPHSSPAEVGAWLRVHGHDGEEHSALNHLQGWMLLSMSKDELALLLPNTAVNTVYSLYRELHQEGTYSQSEMFWPTKGPAPQKCPMSGGLTSPFPSLPFQGHSPMGPWKLSVQKASGPAFSLEQNGPTAFPLLAPNATDSSGPP